MRENRFDTNRHRSKLRAYGAIIFLVFLVLIFLVLVVANSENRYNSDFLKFYLSARFMLGGEGIYTPLTLDTIPGDIQIEPELFDHPILANLNPPILALFMSPLARISYPNAYIVWWLVSLTLGLLSVYLINNAGHQNLSQQNFFELSIIFLLFFPTLLTFLSGQISTLLLFLVVIAWVAGRKGKDRLSGIALGVALSLKLFTGLFIPVLMIQRRWKLLGWYLGTFITLNLVALISVGLDNHIDYLKTISSISWYSASWNTSLMGFLTRIFGGSDSIPLINSPTTGLIINFVVSSIIVITLLWLTKKSDKEKMAAFDLVFSLTIVSMLLISPLGWIYYYVLLLIPLVAAWSAAKKLDSKITQGMIVAAWILCSVPYPLLQGEDIRLVDMFVWSGFPFYGLLLFFIILTIQIRKFRNIPYVQQRENNIKSISAE